MKAEVNFKTIYEAVGSNDSGWGGNHYSFPVGYASTHYGAQTLARGKGGWGSDGSVKEVAAVEIDGRIYLVTGPIDLDGKEAEAKENFRQNALAKLTPAEREALGVK
jgi:hypothetical protein